MSLPPGWRMARVAATRSTNADLVEAAERGAPEGTALIAEVQTAGRGREGRAWQSPAGNLCLSAILRPRCAPAQAGQIGILAALAVADLLRALGVAPRLKWPNDVLVDGAKIAGVLVETGLRGVLVDWAVVGIGLNVATCPEGLAYPATSLAAVLRDKSGAPSPCPSPARGEGTVPRRTDSLPPCGGGSGRGSGTAPSALELAPKLLHHLAASYATWRADGFAPLRDAWRALGPTPGAAAQVRLAGARISGAFHDLDSDGALVLEVSPGQQRRIIAGDWLPA